MGSVLFESRIGALGNPPSKGAQEFVHNLMGFFKYMQPLMYNMPVYKYINTPTWRTYEEYGDKVHEAGLKMVQKVSTVSGGGRRGMSSAGTSTSTPPPGGRMRSMGTRFMRQGSRWCRRLLLGGRGGVGGQ